jgi:hypothetical protein
MPEIVSCDYLLELWQGAGIVKSNGMGLVPLDWQDIHAFSIFNDVNPFEARLIVEMSRNYSQGNNMSKPNSRAPYQREYTDSDMIAMEKSADMQEAAHMKKEMQKLL